ncbi:hypothetical protein EVA_22585, partial [gut metagenome]
ERTIAQRKEVKNERQNAILSGQVYQPPVQGDEQTEFFFSSLAAIYEQFTPEQVGCYCQNLYNLKVSDGNTYEGDLCEI